MKRTIHIFVTAALLLSLLVCLSVAAFAAEQVYEVDVSGITLTPGAALPATAATGEYGTVTGISWEKWNFTTNAWEAVSGNVENGNAYRMTARVTANDGYAFDSACLYYINGEYQNSWSYGDGTYVDVVHAFPVGLTEITQISFATEPAVAEGGDPAAALSGLTLPADAGYTLVRSKWYRVDIASSTRGDLSGSFQSGQVYELECYLAPKAGYWFARWTDVSAPHYENSNISADEATVWVNLRYYLTTPIDKVDVTITGVEEGKPAADVQITLPDGASYGVDSFRIVDSSWNEFNGTFGKDGYTVELYLTPNQGHHFSEDAQITVNGGTPDYFNAYAGGCNVEAEFDFRPPIDKVDITITGVEQGKSAADVKVAIPDGANYVLEDIYILDGDRDSFSGTFGKDGYTVDIYLAPAKGYCFAEDAVITVNGGQPDYEYTDSDYCNVEADFDFRSKITNVELPAWPQIKAGDTVPDAKPVDPDGKLYEYAIIWTDYTTGDVAQGTFADNKVYAAVYQVMADEGYAFAEDVAITIGGGTYTGLVENYGNGVLMIKMYALGDVKLIDRFDVTVDAPAIGAKPGKASVAKDAGYTLADSYWGVSDNDKLNSIQKPGDVFKVGEHVYLGLEFSLEEGTLDPNVKLYINGKEYEMIEEFTGFGRDYYYTAVYLGQLLNEIDTFKVSGAHPSAGRTPGAVTDAGSENCKLENAVWAVSKEAGKDIKALSGNYAAGDHAYLTLTYAFDDTYTAADGFKVLFNGKEYPVVADMTSVADGKLTATIYLGQLKAASNPGTGDTTPVAALTVLAVASVLGMGLLIGRRKAF